METEKLPLTFNGPMNGKYLCRNFYKKNGGKRNDNLVEYQKASRTIQKLKVSCKLVCQKNKNLF